MFIYYFIYYKLQYFYFEGLVQVYAEMLTSRQILSSCKQAASTDILYAPMKVYSRQKGLEHSQRRFKDYFPFMQHAANEVFRLFVCIL